MADGAGPAGAESDADTIAARTRTKFSLVDVPIDTLEASLPDAALEAAVETEEDREYQRFLSSLLPNEQENLSFLDEEDEEYRPDDEEDDHEDEDARRGISKKELTDLLLDSTLTFTKLSTAGAAVAVAVAPAPEPPREDVLTVDNSDVSALPVATTATAVVPDATAATKSPMAMNLTDSAPAMLRGHRGAVTQTQCIQLASQMHKHLQLLLQSYHLLSQGRKTPELAECRAMIEELQQRGEKALKYKNALLSKLNPATTGGVGAVAVAGSSEVEVEDVDAGGDKTPSAADPSGGECSASTTENLLALRRVTRSLTAAHAAVAHPSMFELVGSQTVDELSAGFARGCSVEDRNRAIQEQMLQLDMHLIVVKKRRKSKKGYTTTEDNLLAHGVKRFGTQLESWEHIRQHFLPSKTAHNLRHRYKYLISAKTGMSAVKALHQKITPPHPRNTGWLLEEDLRIARGLVELHSEKYHFARLAKSYLPHRSRLEIRKRWERISAKFRSELAGMGLTAPDDDSLDLAVAMKEYLEAKLRNRMVRQRKEAERSRLDAALQLQQLSQAVRFAFLAQPVGGYVPTGVGDRPRVSAPGSSAQKKASDATFCKIKNLHPALFFSSWSFISPATLLNSTCKHNWPSFMDAEKNSKEKLQQNQLNIDVADEGVSPPADANGQPITLGVEEIQDFMPIEMPSELAGAPTTDLGLTGQTKILMDARMAQKESEEEEDDSDYEHDELLSSENEESDSEFEQMEFTDDDEEVGDEGSTGTFEEDIFMSDSDAQSVESAHSLMTPSQSPLSSPSSHASTSNKASHKGTRRSPRLRHTLRLQNLGQPGNERTKRALAALERRIAGKSVDGSAPSSVASSQTGPSNRAKRKVMSTLVAPLNGGQAPANAAFQVNAEELSLTTLTTPNTEDNEANDNNDNDDEDWEDGSGDEEFEVVELPSSSDEFATASSDEEDQEEVPSPSEPSARTQPRRAAPTDISELPNKKARLQQCPTCGHTSCTCSSSERMQLLLRRMKEKRSSSSLQ
ncbi:SANT/Myb domain [Phytophthora cinnamomi]|uniref:SANT/Myb domain n=1 Tax=Phytophthora cinnamomi TaxID=4785 RepID=UPI00355A42DE|nr:SANT/Myb domain [Phytophthora cinnamomi]